METFFKNRFKDVSSEFDPFKGRCSSLQAALYSGRAFLIFEDDKNPLEFDKDKFGPQSFCALAVHTW